RLGPRVERPADDGARGVGDDERFVVLEHRAEAVAPGARATRVIKGEEVRRERRRRGAARGAGGMLGEAVPVAVVEGERDALPLVERGCDRIGETAAVLDGGANPIYDDQDIFRSAH